MPAVFAFTPKFQQLKSDGTLGEGLQVFTFAAGTAPSTKQSSYTDSTGNTANDNPHDLNARGEMNLWLDTGLLYDIWVCSSTEADPPVNNLWSISNFGFPQTITGPLTITGNLTVNGAITVGAYVALTSSAASIAVNLALSNNFTHTLTENTTLAAPTNATAGQSGAIEFTQHASAAKTLAYNAFWKWAGGTAGTISATVGAKSVLCYLVDSTGAFATCTMNTAVT